MKQLLVETCLEFLGNYQYLVIVFLELLGNVIVRNAIVVHVCLGTLVAIAVNDITRECHQGLDGTMILLLDNAVDDLLVVGCRLSRVTYHHRFSLMVDFVDGELHELVNNHTRLSQLDILVLSQPLANHLQGFLLLKELVLVLIGMLLYQLKLGLVADIVLGDIKDKLLVDGLLHGVQVMGRLSILSIKGISLVLWRGSKSEIRNMAHHLTIVLHLSHQSIQRTIIFIRIVIAHLLQVLLGGKRTDQVLCRLIADGSMSLVHNDGIFLGFLMLEIIERKGKLLHGGNDDSILAVQGIRQFLGTLADVLHRSCRHLKVHHILCHIAIEHNTVCHHDDAVKDSGAIRVCHVGKLVCQPSHRLGFSTTCGMLNQIIVSWSFLTNQATKFSHRTELVETRENDHGTLLLLLGVLVLVILIVTLDEVFQQVEDGICLQNPTPHIGCRIFAFDGRIDGLLVERKKRRFLTIQERGHEGILIIHDKVNQTASQHSVMWVTVSLVLQYAMRIVLVRTFVFQLEGK